MPVSPGVFGARDDEQIFRIIAFIADRVFVVVGDYYPVETLSFALFNELVGRVFPVTDGGVHMRVAAEPDSVWHIGSPFVKFKSVKVDKLKNTFYSFILCRSAASVRRVAAPYKLLINKSVQSSRVDDI